MKIRMKHVLLGIGISMFALQVQAQTAPEDGVADKREMRREVPNPEKIAQKETDRLKEALALTDKQYKKVYKLLLKEQRELLESMTQRPPMMGGEGGPRPPHEGGMPPMGEGRPEGMQRPPMMDAPKHGSAEDMQKRIEKKNKKMKKILTETQYDQWLGMSQKPMPNHKPEEKDTYGHKKRSTAVLQPLLTLKSNTMKNTLQRYGLWRNLQILGVKQSVL